MTAVVVAKSSGILCGVQAAETVFRRIDPRCRVGIFLKDGSAVSPGKKVLSVRGDLSKILAGERSALNILQHLSGVATLTRAFVDQVKGTRAKIYDTRKTLPGLRIIEKYAVRCGGGVNHRMTLKDAVMVKDNHWKALQDAMSEGEAKNMILSLKSRLPRNTPLLIEATSLDQIDVALAARADVLMVDNMTIPRIRQAVRRIRSTASKPVPQIEVTGGVTLANVRQIARCGVDRISVGRITHSAPALDLSLDIL